MILGLAQASWVSAHHHCLVTGPTGVGKSFIACALAQAAIRRGHTALYVPTPRLLADLHLARGDGRHPRLLAQPAKVGFLLLENFLITPIVGEEAKDLLEVIDNRNQVRSTMVASQLPVESWHGALSDPTLADAILDRLVPTIHRVALKGPSTRSLSPCVTSRVTAQTAAAAAAARSASGRCPPPRPLLLGRLPHAGSSAPTWEGRRPRSRPPPSRAQTPGLAGGAHRIRVRRLGPALPRRTPMPGLQPLLPRARARWCLLGVRPPHPAR
jgi:energy-coupling factor transporter ATP-binding protein EcfA2